MSQGIKELVFITEDEQLIALCKQYWEIGGDGNFVHTVTSLTKKRGTSSHKKFSQLVSESCNAQIRDFVCSSCNKQLSVSTRTEYEQYSHAIERGEKYICPDCAQKATKLKAELAEAEKQEKIRIIKEHYEQTEIPPLDTRDLSFKEAVYLLALIRVGAYENFSSIRPLELFETPLSPQEEFDYEILKTLYQNNQLFIHPDSSVEAFTPFVDGKIDKFYVGKVMWLWRPTTNEKEKNEHWRLAAEIENIFKAEDWPQKWTGQGEHIELWKKVALNECFAYLQHSLGQHQMSFNPGEKTTQTFLPLLSDFSVGQIWCFIWRAAKDAAAYYQRGGISRQQAANSVVGSIQRQAERALAGEWVVPNYRRIPQIPVSLVAQVLFVTALKIGDNWMEYSIKKWIDIAKSGNQA